MNFNLISGGFAFGAQATSTPAAPFAFGAQVGKLLHVAICSLCSDDSDSKFSD